MRRLVWAASAVLSLVVAAAQPAAAAAEQAGKLAEYDSLVLSLSWSPTWCATRPGHGDHEQCDSGKNAFVLHGLWPQYARGVKHPRKCLTGTEVPDKVADQIVAVMPSHKLIEREWERHGACIDKDPAAYFTKTRAAYDRVKVPASLRSADQARTMTPDDIRKAFVDANSGLTADAVAVSCHMPRKKGDAEPPKAADLNDVRICMDKNLKFAACPSNVRDRCPDSVTIPAAAKGK